MLSKYYTKKLFFLCLGISLSASLLFAINKNTENHGFPAQVQLKTSHQTFTHKFFFLLHEGRIWVKSRISGEKYPKWEILNGHGLPAKSKEARPYKSATNIKSLSADGDNLIAIDTSNIVYYTKTYNWKWKDHFSVIPMTKKLKLPQAKRAFGISHRGSFMKHYSDIDGNMHSIGAGVTTLYLLAKNGHIIYFADPWLPPKFSHIIDTPSKGSFIATNMAVSGSTIFLINKAGEMYTRLYDYDTSGQNPVLAYSYKREKRTETPRGSVRSLPPENWRKQPPIYAPITDSITIFQNGRGNSSFELRVEGKNKEGISGYFSKKIYDTAWTFTKTNLPLTGTMISPNTAQNSLFTPPKTKCFSGKIHRGKLSIKAKISEFWPYSPPAHIIFTIKNMTFKAKLHMRKYHKKKSGKLACAATIELPASLVNSKDKEVCKVFSELFKSNSLIDMVLVIDKNKLNGAEDLHIIGLAEIADNIISLISKNGFKGELKAKFHKRLRLSFSE